MTDIALLELAAKAVKFRINSYQHGKANCNDVYAYKHNFHWNPLTDNGDALRLAVHLNISFTKYKSDEFITCRVVDYANSNVIIIEQPIENDQEAATRRAIVLAAAELGKNM